MPNSRLPRTDGLSTNFCKEFLEDLTPHMTLLKSVVQKCCLSPSMRVELVHRYYAAWKAR